MEKINTGQSLFLHLPERLAGLEELKELWRRTIGFRLKRDRESEENTRVIHFGEE